MYADRKLNPLFNDNRLKLATFSINHHGIMTNAPEVPIPSIKEIMAAARIADQNGFEAIIAAARWKGYIDGKPDHRANFALDAFSHAAALSQITEQTALFATTHGPTLHPVAVARHVATIDQLSGGRFGLNIVAGWNRREFDMFGVELIEHDKRYEYMADWLKIVKELLESPDEVNANTPYFDVKGGVCRPQPLQRPVPIMNAGLSPVGMRFAGQHSDIGLVTLFGYSQDAWAAQVRQIKAYAAEFGRTMQVFTNVVAVVRDTDAEAQEFLDYYSKTHQDTEVVDGFMDTINANNALKQGTPQYDNLRYIIVAGHGYPLVGSPETVARQMKAISDAGIDGILFTWVNPLEDILRVTRNVLPILEEYGLRRAYQPSQA